MPQAVIINLQNSNTTSFSYELLLAQCRDDKPQAQKAIYERLFGQMFSICKRYLYHEADAQEVCNTGFLKVFTRLEQYGNGGNFEAWVRRIMVNSCLDFLRSKKVYQEHYSLEHDYSETKTYNYGLENLRLEELYEIIDRINPTSRTVFNLFAIDGFSHKEIADQLGMSEGTSKWHLFEARRQIKDLIKVIDEYPLAAHG